MTIVLAICLVCHMGMMAISCYMFYLRLMSLIKTRANKVNQPDVFFGRCTRRKYAGYLRRYSRHAQCAVCHIGSALSYRFHALMGTRLKEVIILICTIYLRRTAPAAYQRVQADNLRAINKLYFPQRSVAA